MSELTTLSVNCLVVLLDASIKAMALAVLAVLCLGVVRVESPALRHAVWATVLCGMLGIPFLSLALPRAVLPLLPGAIGPARGAVSPAPLAESSSVDASLSTLVRQASHENASLSAEIPLRPVTASTSPPLVRATWPIVAFGGYLAGVVVFFGRFLLGLDGCLRLVQASRRITLDRLEGNIPSALGRAFHERGVQMLECATIRVPVTMGSLRPRILLPVDWSLWRSSKLEAVLAHIERRDTLFALLGAINQCLYWFHPLAWLVPKRLAALSEHACDDRAIALIGAPIPYARHLLEFAASLVDQQHRPTLGSLSMANSGDLRARINTILDSSRVISAPLSRRSVLLTTTIAFLLVPALAVLRIGPRTLSSVPETQKSAAQNAAETAQPGREPETEFTYAGSVLGVDEKPVTGARLYLTKMRGYYREPFPAAHHATTGLDGRFRFTVPIAGIHNEKSVVAALAANHGVGWVEVPADGKRDDLILHLKNDDVPIVGQVVDLEGRPVPEATFRVLEIDAATGEMPGPKLKKKGSMRDDTDLELSAVIDQEDGAACHNPMRFEELCAWIGAARHALKGAECNWTQDVA